MGTLTFGVGGLFPFLSCNYWHMLRVDPFTCTILATSLHLSSKLPRNTTLPTSLPLFSLSLVSMDTAPFEWDSLLTPKKIHPQGHALFILIWGHHVSHTVMKLVLGVPLSDGESWLVHWVSSRCNPGDFDGICCSPLAHNISTAAATTITTTAATAATTATTPPPPPLPLY